MISANELRIGNFVNYHERINTVYGFNDGSKFIDITDDDQAEIEECEYIPLTEEWLLKFGFEKCLSDGCPVSEGERFSDWRKDCFIVDKYGYEVDFCNSAVQIKFVHQLQNLYFACTGQELTIHQPA